MALFSRSDLRLFFLALIMFLGLGSIVARLWELQVMRGDTYATKIGGKSQVTVRIPSVRGEIRDRNGIPLVQNRASYNVDFYLQDMVKGYRSRNGPVPTLSVMRTQRDMPKNILVPDILKIVNTAVIPRLEDLDLARDYNAKHLQLHFDHDTLVPFPYIEDVDFATIARFSEHDVGLPGVDISQKPVRQYLYGAFASHILGYVGMPRNIDELPDVRAFTFYQPDVEGKNQIEQSMDAYLKGKPGARVIQRDAKGRMESEVRVDPPKPGSNVYLTIDAQIQYIVEQALRNPSLGRAAAVVVDPNNGDILAIASIPSFDPNVFIPSVSPKDWNVLLKDPAVPLVNRAVSGFPPGSTFKIVTALSGLTKGLDKQHFSCSGSIDYGGREFHCWIAGKGSHGTLGLADALKVSCDVFFYQYGNAAGPDTIARIGGILGLGQKYELGLSDEKEGCMPGPKWMEARYPGSKWTSAYTANVSIGQGYVLASPLQMAMAYATVANGGIAYEPRLIRTVLEPNGRPTLDDDGKVAVPDQPKIREDLRKEGLTADQIEVVRQGLWKVVNEEGGNGGGGTGKAGRVKGTVVAGKTGTAQATDRGQKEDIAWFCCFAPYDHPKYVIAVMVQGGAHGGSVAGPVAAHILEQCLARDEGRLKVELKPLAPAHNDHPFAQFASLAPYGNETGLVPVFDDPSDSTHEAPAEGVQMDQGNASPDIKAEADDQGRVVPRTVRKAVPVSPDQQPKPTLRRAQPAAQPEQPHRNFLERIFNPNRKPN